MNSGEGGFGKVEFARATVLRSIIKYEIIERFVYFEVAVIVYCILHV